MQVAALQTERRIDPNDPVGPAKHIFVFLSTKEKYKNSKRCSGLVYSFGFFGRVIYKCTSDSTVLLYLSALTYLHTIYAYCKVVYNDLFCGYSNVLEYVSLKQQVAC